MYFFPKLHFSRSPKLLVSLSGLEFDFLWCCISGRRLIYLPPVSPRLAPKESANASSGNLPRPCQAEAEEPSRKGAVNRVRTSRKRNSVLANQKIAFFAGALVGSSYFSFSRTYLWQNTKRIFRDWFARSAANGFGLEEKLM